MTTAVRTAMGAAAQAGWGGQVAREQECRVEKGGAILVAILAIAILKKCWLRDCSY